MLAELRKTVAHGKSLEPTNVQPFAVPYLGDPQLERRVRDFVRGVIARVADPSYRP